MYTLQYFVYNSNYLENKYIEANIFKVLYIEECNRKKG